MTNIQLQGAAKKAVKSRFHGHPTLTGKTIPHYPDTAEREFKRITNAYVKMLNDELKKELPALMQEYGRERRGDSRFDDIRDLERKVREMFQRIAEALEKKMADFWLDKRITAVARMTKNTSLREWKRAVRETLGIDLLNDYYNASFYEEQLRRWIDENVLKIKSIPSQALDGMRQIILEGYTKGQTVREIQKDIQEAYSVTKHKAQLLARDQISTLNAQITESQMRDAGCSRYKWSTSRDSRVRECHASFEGKVFSLDEPPEMWYRTKSRGIVYTGRRCHPGEDFCCRCVRIPIFNFDSLSVPLAGDGNEGVSEPQS